VVAAINVSTQTGPLTAEEARDRLVPPLRHTAAAIAADLAPLLRSRPDT
jgi:DNA-binding IclR family transcriptional regulator